LRTSPSISEFANAVVIFLHSSFLCIPQVSAKVTHSPFCTIYQNQAQSIKHTMFPRRSSDRNENPSPPTMDFNPIRLATPSEREQVLLRASKLPFHVDDGHLMVNVVRGGYSIHQIRARTPFLYRDDLRRVIVGQSAQVQINYQISRAGHRAPETFDAIGPPARRASQSPIEPTPEPERSSSGAPPSSSQSRSRDSAPSTPGIQERSAAERKRKMQLEVARLIAEAARKRAWKRT
jgi:hypothetical protein